MEGWDGKLPPEKNGYSGFFWISLIVFGGGITLHILHLQLTPWYRYTATTRPLLADDPRGVEGAVFALLGLAGLIGWGIVALRQRK